MGGVSLTVRVSKFSQASLVGFSLVQGRGGDRRNVEYDVQVRLNEGEFSVLHLTLKRENRSSFQCSKVGRGFKLAGGSTRFLNLATSHNYSSRDSE